MRFLFTTTGHAGHVLPLVPFARACIRAGHEVRVAAPRSRGAAVERAGLPFWPFDDPPEDEVWAVFEPTAAMPSDEANAVVIGDIFGRLDTAAALPGVLAIAEAWRPDAIVRESYEFASVLSAERLGIPHVRVATGLASTEEWLLRLAEARIELPVERILASPYLTTTPSGLDDGPAVHRFRETVPRPLPNRWGEPLVYVTFGSVASGTPLFPGLYRATLEALAETPARVLMTIGDNGDPAALGALPANVQVERWVPHGKVLPHAAAIVCHGGYGTTVGGLVHGVPLVVVPVFADQGRNARRVAEIGAGIALPEPPSILAAAESGAVAGLTGHVRRVLEEPAYRRAARGVATLARSLPPVETAPAVLEAIAGRRERRRAA
jgi:UDP:flavonoid glycosyltransferase YjiC (YdhE family)